MLAAVLFAAAFRGTGVCENKADLTFLVISSCIWVPRPPISMLAACAPRFTQKGFYFTRPLISPSLTDCNLEIGGAGFVNEHAFRR